MDYNEIARLFLEFKKYDNNNRIPATDKLERFYDYIVQRIRILNTLTQIINHRTGKHVDTMLISSVDNNITEKLDKMVRYYFKQSGRTPLPLNKSIQERRNAKMTSDTIKLQIDFCDFHSRFGNVLNDDNIYSSAAGREYVRNYRNHISKRGNNDPLDIIPNALGRAAHDAVLYAVLRKSIDKAVKDAVIKSGGTWTD